MSQAQDRMEESKQEGSVEVLYAEKDKLAELLFVPNSGFVRGDHAQGQRNLERFIDIHKELDANRYAQPIRFLEELRSIFMGQEPIGRKRMRNAEVLLCLGEAYVGGLPGSMKEVCVFPMHTSDLHTVGLCILKQIRETLLKIYGEGNTSVWPFFSRFVALGERVKKSSYCIEIQDLEKELAQLKADDIKKRERNLANLCLLCAQAKENTLLAKYVKMHEEALIQRQNREGDVSTKLFLATKLSVCDVHCGLGEFETAEAYLQQAEELLGVVEAMEGEQREMRENIKEYRKQIAAAKAKGAATQLGDEKDAEEDAEALLAQALALSLGNTDEMEVAKTLSMQEAIEKGTVGPRVLPDWNFKDVDDRGDCFYDALALQLVLLKDPFVVSVSAGKTVGDALREEIQREKFKKLEWAEDKEILETVRVFPHFVIAIVDTRDTQQRWVYYYWDASRGCVDHSSEEKVCEGKVKIRLAFTGNHYMSVLSAPGEEYAPTAEDLPEEPASASDKNEASEEKEGPGEWQQQGLDFFPGEENSGAYMQVLKERLARIKSDNFQEKEACLQELVVLCEKTKQHLERAEYLKMIDAALIERQEREGNVPLISFLITQVNLCNVYRLLDNCAELETCFQKAKEYLGIVQACGERAPQMMARIIFYGTGLAGTCCRRGEVKKAQEYLRQVKEYLVIFEAEQGYQQERWEEIFACEADIATIVEQQGAAHAEPEGNAEEYDEEALLAQAVALSMQGEEQEPVSSHVEAGARFLGGSPRRGSVCAQAIPLPPQQESAAAVPQP